MKFARAPCRYKIRESVLQHNHIDLEMYLFIKNYRHIEDK